MNRVLVVGCLCVMLGGCSGTGTVALQLTDAPVDTEELASVFVTLAGAEVHVVQTDTAESESDDPAIDQDNKWVSVPLERTTVDLLTLRDGVFAPLGEAEVPEGKITQIRLRLDAAGRNEVVTKAGATCSLDLRAVEPTGVKIAQVFKAVEVRAGYVSDLLLDFDVAESLSHDGGCAYALKPVVKLVKSSVSRK